MNICDARASTFMFDVCFAVYTQYFLRRASWTRTFHVYDNYVVCRLLNTLFTTRVHAHSCTICGWTLTQYTIHAHLCMMCNWTPRVVPAWSSPRQVANRRMEGRGVGDWGRGSKVGWLCHSETHNSSFTCLPLPDLYLSDLALRGLHGGKGVWQHFLLLCVCVYECVCGGKEAVLLLAHCACVAEWKKSCAVKDCSPSTEPILLHKSSFSFCS